MGLTEIRCLSQLRNGPSVRDFAGQTVEGIRIGDTLTDLTTVYGKPDLVHRDVVHCVRSGWTFYMRDDKVAGINISTPVPEEIEITIGEDGSVTHSFRGSDE